APAGQGRQSAARAPQGRAARLGRTAAGTALARRARRHEVAHVQGLYLHVPFCSAICHYCNFNRGLLDDAMKTRYVGAMERHIASEGAGEPVDTIFLGGGTPSLLAPLELRRLLDACRRAFDVTSDAEITLEANPETVDARQLAAFREAGVTRLSFGVQSFRDAELKRLGRIHDAARARRRSAER